MRFARLAALIVAITGSGCSTPRFTPADPAAPNTIPRCVGTIARVVHHPDAEVTTAIDLVPVASDRRLLAEGQTRLPCVVLTRHAHNFGRLPEGLTVGQRVEIAGYFVRDRNGEHALRPVTSIDVHPDR